MRSPWASRHTLGFFLCATRFAARGSDDAPDEFDDDALDDSNSSANATETYDIDANDTDESESSHSPTWTVPSRSCQGVDLEYSLCTDLPACNPCDPVDCRFSSWSDWNSGDCTGLCQRQRGVDVANNPCGAPCRGALTESKGGLECLSCDESSDCEWGSWLEWDGCTKSCDGGFRTRLRFILHAPVNGGRICAALPRSEVEPCNTTRCEALSANCLDVHWRPWTSWSACTADCSGGVQWRARYYPEDKTDWCPLPSGNSQEMRNCNVEPCVGDIDCQFSDWDPWSGCSCSCNGVMRRARRISIFGRGKGKYCEAATKEIAQCNPAEGDEVSDDCTVDAKYVPIDCRLSIWTEWDACSATCDGGQRQRSRMVEQEPDHGGKTCAGVVEDLEPCNTQECHEVVLLTACEWSHWDDWSDCELLQDRCGAGVKKRSRVLLNRLHVDGRRCGQPSEEVAFCYRECQHHCVWADWGPYGDCSATCGGSAVCGGYATAPAWCGGSAVKKRQREMTLSIVPVDDLFDASYKDLHLRAEEAENHRVQVAALAFGGGVLGVVLGFFVVRATARPHAAE